jgi:Family of unknown function (DUF6176)
VLDEEEERMARFSFAVPVLPGKRQVLDEVIEHSRQNMGEYRQSRERAGITMERASLMSSPMGEFVIAYVEGRKGFNDVLEAFQSGGDFDRRFLERNGEVSGIDFSSAVPAPPEPELVADWSDPQVTQRKPGISFCAPLAPGKTDEARAFGKEWTEARRDEHTQSRRRLGLTHETVFLNPTPNGDIVCVYLEGDDPAEANRRFAESRDPYDVWFKDQCRKVFIPDIDFNIPLPPITVLWDWEAATVAS